MPEPETAAERLELALGMHEDGVTIMRENLRRRDPGASDAEIEDRVAAWLAVRPGAEAGDGDGVPGRWPRPR